jgi:LDH2 family malate/lactate/ureidoglycolate dehydrogenase
MTPDALHMTTYRQEDLFSFAEQVFTRLGMPEQDARVAADSLIRADLEDAGSHGISRLGIYAKRLGEGRIAARPAIGIEPHGSILHVDGGNGLGQVVSMRALQAAMELAGETGIVGAFVRGSNHFGTAAYYCQHACDNGMALIAMTNSPPGIPPWGGRKAFFGTNPLAFGFPIRPGQPPVIVDMSSSVAARGKIILADKQGEPIPTGWAIDENGAPTTDPAAALRGAVLPLGGAKGYALALAIEAMVSLLSQAAFGPHVRNLYKENENAANVGHCFLVLNIGKWLNYEEYAERMEHFLAEIRAVPLAEGAESILIPGERRERIYNERMVRGISLSPEVIEELRELSVRYDVHFPQPKGGESL